MLHCMRGRPTRQLDVRDGSLADIETLQLNVRFTPKSRHAKGRSRCPLCANSGRQPSDWPFITASNPLYGLVFCHCNHGAGERAVELPQLIQNREVIGVGDRYQVTWDMTLRPVGMVIATARDHSRQLAGP